jgi:peptide deformylase
MEIVLHPHPALRWKAKPVTEINAKLRKIISEMFELMYEHNGVGLAATQVALPYRFFIINPTSDPEEKDQEFIFINPEISNRKGSVEGEEGCLSLPELYGQVRRAESIRVEAFDLKGRDFYLDLDELPARIVQHEYDHLDGVLFTDRMADVAKRELDPQLEDFEAHFRRQQEADEISSDKILEKNLRDLEESWKDFS